jgi:RHS repeat-associated protein
LPFAFSRSVGGREKAAGGRLRLVPHRAGSSYTYDADGNLATEAGPGDTRYLTFDSQNRPTCRGTTPGGCDIFLARYDADGNRIRTRVQWFPQKVYAGEFFQLNVDDDIGLFQIFAFGEQIAHKRADVATLRTAPAGWLLALRFELPPPLAWGLLLAAGLGAGGLLLVRLEWADAARQEPAWAALSLLLTVALALPPVPASGGGSGPVLLRYWLLTDHLGSGVAWVGESGAAYRETLYSPFGKIVEEVSSGENPPNIFAGHQDLRHSGYVYMQARWYDPGSGTFLSVDPVVADAGDPQAYNAYAYVRNNPVNATDPTGMYQYECYGSCSSASPGAPPGWAPSPVSFTSFTATVSVGGVFVNSETFPSSELNSVLYQADELGWTVSFAGGSLFFDSSALGSPGLVGGGGGGPSGGGVSSPPFDPNPDFEFLPVSRDQCGDRLCDYQPVNSAAVVAIPLVAAGAPAALGATARAAAATGRAVQGATRTAVGVTRATIQAAERGTIQAAARAPNAVGFTAGFGTGTLQGFNNGAPGGPNPLSPAPGGAFGIGIRVGRGFGNVQGFLFRGGILSQ